LHSCCARESFDKSLESDKEYVIAKAENERDLKKEFTPRGEDRYAVSPPDTMLPP
jgi:hypothetical protein